ncbi:GGDEF domain-containing protein [Glaciecola sp. SC05]|uniref:GGDEF domain-containing protein n=1 Tax=Glaciecola sp. SC05 TaxID=1987355 RepID=UPI0035272EFE
MKFSDDSGQAANYLRQAIPTMVKHNIVPNPLNYTLWYSYFSETFPALNQELDQVIERYGTCPAKIGESLFIQHISQVDDKNEEQLENFQKAISHLVNNLSDSLDHTAKQTDGYSAALKDNISALENHDVDEAMRPVLSELNANATAIYDANQQFHGQLSSAQSEINQLKMELEKSRVEANTDPLTGLSNRRVLDAIYRQFMDDHEKEDELSLIIMDIDKFKVFNDTHGHLIGDQILKFVGELLKKECPKSIIPVRFGGEEFAMLCPNFSIDEARDVAENIRVKLSTTQFNHKKTGAKLPPVTASFGCAAKIGKELLTQIIERADKALYVAKDQGRNQVQLA